MSILNTVTEDQARELLMCLGCGKAKDKGLVVCWTCFKYTTAKTPLKYFDGSLVEWLQGGAK